MPGGFDPVKDAARFPTDARAPPRLPAPLPPPPHLGSSSMHVPAQSAHPGHPSLPTQPTRLHASQQQQQQHQQQPPYAGQQQQQPYLSQQQQQQQQQHKAPSRRATDLSVLLNSAGPSTPSVNPPGITATSPLFTPVYTPAAGDRRLPKADYFPPPTHASAHDLQAQVQTQAQAHLYAQAQAQAQSQTRPQSRTQTQALPPLHTTRPGSRSSVHDLLTPVDNPSSAPYYSTPGGSGGHGDSRVSPRSSSSRRSSVLDLMSHPDEELNVSHESAPGPSRRLSGPFTFSVPSAASTWPAASFAAGRSPEHTTSRPSTSGSLFASSPQQSPRAEFRQPTQSPRKFLSPQII
jgi:hypothetical protein